MFGLISILFKTACHTTVRVVTLWWANWIRWWLFHTLKFGKPVHWFLSVVVCFVQFSDTKLKTWEIWLEGQSEWLIFLLILVLCWLDKTKLIMNLFQTMNSVQLLHAHRDLWVNVSCRYFTLFLQPICVKSMILSFN